MIKDITAIVVDLNRSASQIKSFVEKEKEQQNPVNPDGSPRVPGLKSPPSKQDPLPKGMPRVVYWGEN